MIDINKIIKHAMQNGNKISFDELDRLKLSEDELEELVAQLSDANIEVYEIDDNYEESAYTKDYDLYYEYLKDIGKYPRIDITEEQRLSAQIKQGDKKAEEKLIQCNLRLVISIAKKYSYNQNFDIMDLIQEGNIGLQKAAQKYDATRGYKFSTYATLWIKQCIQRYLSEALTVRVPANAYMENKRLKKFCADYFSKNGYEPSLEEIAKTFGWTLQKTKVIFFSEKEIISLDKPISGDSEDGTLKDFIPDLSNMPQDVIEKSDSYRLIVQIMENNLTPREFMVLKYRFGIDDGIEMKLEDVGKKFNITRERVRQIENKALKKLKICFEMYEKDFINNQKSKKNKKKY